MVLLRLQDEFGSVFAKRYHDRLVHNILAKVRAGSPFELGPLLRTRQSDVVTELRLSSAQAPAIRPPPAHPPPHQGAAAVRQPGAPGVPGTGRRAQRTARLAATGRGNGVNTGKGGGRGGGGKGRADPSAAPALAALQAAPPGKGQAKPGALPAPPALMDQPAALTPSEPPGTGKGKGKRPQVCLQHDARHHMVCEDSACVREHLDTTDPAQAARFDAASFAAGQAAGRRNR